MAIGEMAFLSASVGAGSTLFAAMNNWTDFQGNALTTSDAVLVRSVLHEDDATLVRGGDPDDDGTFEISIDITSSTGAGEIHSLTTLYDDVARVGVTDDSGSGQDVIMIGEQVDPSNYWVEQAAGVANGGSIDRTVQATPTEEYVIEAAASASSDIQRELDSGDDGFNADANDIAIAVESGFSGVQTELWLGMVNPEDRNNPAFRTFVINQSGGTADLFMWGTIA